MRSGSAVDAIMKLTGKLSPPGRAEGITGNIWIPGMPASFCCTTGRYATVGVLRTPHGFKTMPPNPLSGFVI